jgi:hypothetical protein
MIRFLAGALVALMLAACGDGESSELSAAEVSRVETVALDLAGSLGDATPVSGVAVAAERRAVADVLWPGTTVGSAEVIVVVLRGDFSLYESPPNDVPERLPVLIVLYDRATMEVLDLGQQEQPPTGDELASLGEVVPLDVPGRG